MLKGVTRLMWQKIVRLSWYGKKTYHPLDLANVPPSPGVYKLHRCLPNGEWEVFYVGKADNLADALLAHLTSTERNQAIVDALTIYDCGFSYALVADAAERDGILKSLYEQFQPEATDPNSIPAEAVQLRVNAN